ncbi:hypothetical protein BGY98DRAFT_1098101 [Russula aff. rugulosa BPL654]|nr:hypothetical protein BGY98DRAFT_1098101 [Russula aff. rugulosa BPL654]
MHPALLTLTFQFVDEAIEARFVTVVNAVRSEATTSRAYAKATNPPSATISPPPIDDMATSEAPHDRRRSISRRDSLVSES